MIRLLWAIVAALSSGFQSRRGLMLENLALRQQLSTVLQKRRPRIGPVDRVFWVVLRRLWSRWSEAVVIVKPETVIGWHRVGFALYWRWLSRRRRLPGRAAVGREVRDLIRRMASENGWGAPRIHGELLKLGFMVSERTVSRYLRMHGRSPKQRQSRFTFLRNHREVIVAMDFFTVPTATFRVLYVWFAIRHSRREIVHWSVTESPTALWVVQQLRETFPFDDAGGRSRYLVLDRDAIFSAAVVAAIASMGLEPTRTSYQSPWQNGVAERFVGAVRRDLLDHVIVLDRTSSADTQRVLGVLPRGSDASRGSRRTRRWLVPRNSALQMPLQSTPNGGSAASTTGTCGPSKRRRVPREVAEHARAPVPVCQGRADRAARMCAHAQHLIAASAPCIARPFSSGYKDGGSSSGEAQVPVLSSDKFHVVPHRTMDEPESHDDPLTAPLRSRSSCRSDPGTT